MNNLIKANFIRIIKNPLYEISCVLALLITVWFTAFGDKMTIFHMGTKEEFAIFIGAGTLAFSAVFVAGFMNFEYSEGVIRNKVTAGHNQWEIFLSNVVSQIQVNMLMLGFWIIGALMGGAHVTQRSFYAVVTALFYNIAFVCIMAALGMRVRNQILASSIGIVVFFVLTNGFLVGNALVAFSEGIVQKVFVIFYNLSPVGQWFANSWYGVMLEMNPGFFTSVLLSVIVSIAAVLLGGIRLNKRELN